MAQHIDAATGRICNEFQPPAEPVAVIDEYANALIGKIRERQECWKPV